uniref:Protein kinase domain-containing protein n=1 Tax=Strigamia maritima TaxID=126957 RepID=T1JMW4_STRMM
MGNGNPKPTKLSKLEKKWHSTQTTKTFSVASYASNCSVYSVSRPWSRSSRRKWKESTLENPMNASKTAWPVSVVESMFMPEFSIKQQIDESHFQIIETVARGAFGKVLKVMKKDDRQFYAMKILSKSHVIKEDFVQQCKDEVAIQVSCSHAFIVNCRFHWQNRKQLFIVTDYYSFGELLVLWKTHHSLPEPVVKIYLAELAIAIDYLHNSGIMYRDLKMENVLLDENGHVKLIDFGLAKWAQHGGRARTICGTIQYMAPEILRMETYTHAVDWWSLGVIIYSLLLGHFPVERVSDHEKMCDLVYEFNYSLPADEFSHDLRQCLQRLLCKDPNRRLQSLYHLKWEDYMKSFDFDAIQERKISPKSVLDECVKKNEKKQIENGSVINGGAKMVIENFSWVKPN